MKLWKTAALSAALLGAAGAGAAIAPVSGQAGSSRAIAPRAAQVFGTGGGRIGVSVTDVDTADSKDAVGARIESVEEGSPAEKAGLKTGDIVVEFDGERVRSVRQFTRLVGETPAGRQVAAVVVRSGQRVSVNVTPRESGAFRFFDDGRRVIEEYAQLMPAIPARPATPRAPVPPRPPSTPFEVRPPVLEWFAGAGNQLGVTVSDVSSQLGEYFGTKGGVLVTSVTDGSVASRAGVKAGDVIVSVNGSAVDDPQDLRTRMRGLDPGEEFTLAIVRDRKAMTLKGKVEQGSSRRMTRTIL